MSGHPGPLRVAVDLQALQVPGFAERGIGRYIVGLTTALLERDRLAVTLLAPELPPATGLPAGLAERGLVRWDGIATVRTVLAEQRPVAHLVAAPFLHVGATDPSTLVAPSSWDGAGVPRAVVLYDLIPLRAPRHYLGGPGDLERYRARAAWVAEADRVLTISDHTRADAIELLGCDPDRVVTIGGGVSDFFGPGDGVDSELFSSRLSGWEERPFVLCVAGSDPRKNTERLIRAMALVPDAGLVVAGHLTPSWLERLRREARSAAVDDRTTLLGDVSDELLRACYRRAALTVMPSLAEGLGLPVLESAACGTPAIASATTALGAAAGRVEATFDPTDARSIAACANRLLRDPALRQEIAVEQAERAAAATWATVAERTLTALEQIPPSRLLPGVPPSRSVALVGPFPPAGGGLGRYHRELAHALSGRVSVTGVSAGVDPAPTIPGGHHLRADLLGTSVRAVAFDAVVHTLGNSAGHLDTVRAALSSPGWLWLHETRLPGVALTALDGLADGEFAGALSGLLHRAYPGRPPLRSAERAGRSNLELIDAGVGLLHLLAARSRGILVNSRAAAALVEIDLPPGTSHPPVHVLPPAVACVDPVGHRGTPGGHVVASFGIVSWAKRPDLLLDACRGLGCRVVFVGPCPAIIEEVIDNIAKHLGIADRVVVTGAVDDDGWRHWLEAADVAVQLRDPSTGEMSAAVLEAMASGVPVVTNLPSAAEYPDGVLRHLRTLSVPALTEVLGALLASPEERRAIREAALDFARRQTFEVLADRLLSVVLP